MKKKTLLAVFAVFTAFSLVACGGNTSTNENSDSSKSATTETQETDTTTTAEEQSETSEAETPEQPLSEGDIGDYHVAIGDCTFTTDVEDKKTIVINYSFTNNSDTATAPLWALSTTAFQDGVELDTAFVMNSDAYDAGIAQKELKPGASLDGCQVAYVLSSDSPVEFEVGELISLNDNVLAKTFTIQ